jgi:uncharacterized FlgJ-related protein
MTNCNCNSCQGTQCGYKTKYEQAKQAFDELQSKVNQSNSRIEATNQLIDKILQTISQTPTLQFQVLIELKKLVQNWFVEVKGKMPKVIK